MKGSWAVSAAKNPSYPRAAALNASASTYANGVPGDR